MNMNLQQSYELLNLRDIPEIDLYVDQVITVLSDFLPVSRPLTKAMINNYSKEGLIGEVRGKRYSKQQIIQIYLICIMKEVLSIQEIKSIMQCFSTAYSWEYVYEQFCENRTKGIELDVINDDSAEADSLQAAHKALYLSCVAGDLKLSVSQLINKNFPQRTNKK